MKAKMSISDGKILNIDKIQGRYTAFERMEWPLTLRLSQPIAEDGYGKITVNGVEIPKGKQFHMNVIVSMDLLTVPVGSVANEYDKEYTMVASGFVGKDGTPFPTTTMKFRTEKRRTKEEPYAYAAHDEAAMQAAREGMVLLQNKNNVLPLAPDSTLNLFGRGQYVFYNTPTGASLINPRWQANFHQSIEEHSSFKVNREISGLYKTLQSVVPSKEQLEAAKKQSDTAVIILSRVAGEFADNRPEKGFYYLTDEERDMIKAVSAAFSKTVAILNTGYPIELRWVEEYGIDAVIYTGFAGMCAGYALMELLDGRANFSGKLPDTFAYDYDDYPCAHNFPNLTAEEHQPGERELGVRLFYAEDIYVGYRYFDSFDKGVAYGFGHGESYTSFDIASSAPSWDGETVSIEAEVTNTGTRCGKEVVQLYMQSPDGRLEKPRRVLCAFEKTVELAPGESQKLKLNADKSVFSSYDEAASAFVLERGEYALWLGNSLKNAEKAGGFALAEEITVQKVTPVARPVEKLTVLTKENSEIKAQSEIVDVEKRIPVCAERAVYAPASLPAYSGKRLIFDDVKKDEKRLEAFVAQMSDKELCRLNVCGGANWYLPWQNGTAGKLRNIRKYKFPTFTVSDGNSGINIKKPNIGFPSSTCIAAAFNKEIAYNVGKIIAEESKENGIQLNLGPGMNIHRNILNGRHPEYFSEDPFLAGTLAGMQGKGLEENGCGCTYKHMFCNNADTSRKTSHSVVSERALREIYFKVFITAMSVHMPSAIMTSYNVLNGIYPAEDATLLQTLIREEWGFDGIIMTDWGTYDTVDAVEMTKAGNCWLTEGGGKYVKQLYAALKSGSLSRNVLENNVLHLMRTLRQLV